MYHFWKKKTHQEIKEIVFSALQNNVNYDSQNVLGIPASYLDDKIFNQDHSFLQDAPFMSTLIQNPNHIGCHTLGKSESFFEGTQAIEKELIEICAVDILKGEPYQQDGYVASGGTEANMQAIWVYRNYYQKKYNAKLHEICILATDDSHYSMDKAGNILSLDVYKLGVNPDTRQLQSRNVMNVIEQAQSDGKKYFITVVNMMTTMFGSVDEVIVVTDALDQHDVIYKLHVDGAYGGFYHPFTNSNDDLTFKNKNITSFTLDAHKMAQAPYGTGIFLIRKGYLDNVNTQEASYVEGEDFTLVGSRSGANAIAVWMILMKNGPYGWQEKIFILQKRTEWMCKELQGRKIDFYRHPYSNIITIRAAHLTAELAAKFGLVPDNHKNPEWYKIVIMEHVTIEKLQLLLAEIDLLTK
jgi:glutamate/tyrosine decarboxylase-like PLP-dependent enzyme